MGLGLRIVQELVESHGGSVRAYSAGLGQGAAFTVSLPLAQGPEDVREAGRVRARTLARLVVATACATILAAAVL